MGAKIRELPGGTLAKIGAALGVERSVIEDYESKRSLADKMKATLDDAGREVDELHGQLTQESQVDGAVEAMLRGEWKPRGNAAGLRQRITDAHERRSVARRASEFQERLANEAETALCKAICQLLKPQYSTVAGRTAAALRSLRQAVVEQEKIADWCRENSVKVYGVWNPLDATMSVEEIDRWLANTNRDGLI